nr:GTP-binding protein EngA [Cryptomonas sp.]
MFSNGSKKNSYNMSLGNKPILGFFTYVNCTNDFRKSIKHYRHKFLRCKGTNKIISQIEHNQRIEHYVKNESPIIFSRRMPIVAVVGRENVGKSTLVNRLTNTSEDRSIVYNTIGVTRDKLYKKASWRDYEYLVTDTGGFVLNKSKKDFFSDEVVEQTLKAIQEASLVIFLVDGKSELSIEDIELARFLKTRKMPVILAVNKSEKIEKLGTDVYKFKTLGLGEAILISAVHGTNTGELLDKVVTYLPRMCLPPSDIISSVVLIGKPNVGKSSILNFLHGEKKSIVSSIPGTTRDSIDSFVSGGNNFNVYNIIDTAGIRQKKLIQHETEFLMVDRTSRAIQKSDCVLIVIDASFGITTQEQKLAEKINKQGKACVILINKWDKVSGKKNHEYENFRELVRYFLPSIYWANMLFVSATDGTRCEKILNLVDLAIDQYNRRVPTSVLNEVVQEAIKWRNPPIIKKNKQGKIYYCTQIRERPPTIAIFVNVPELFNDSYRRYIENQLRNGLGFQGTSLKILWVKKNR